MLTVRTYADAVPKIGAHVDFLDEEKKEVWIVVVISSSAIPSAYVRAVLMRLFHAYISLDITLEVL